MSRTAQTMACVHHFQLKIANIHRILQRDTRPCQKGIRTSQVTWSAYFVSNKTKFDQYRMLVLQYLSRRIRPHRWPQVGTLQRNQSWFPPLARSLSARCLYFRAEKSKIIRCRVEIIQENIALLHILLTVRDRNAKKMA